MSQVKELLQTISERIGAHAGVDKVFGQPIVAEGRTIVPVARVRFGFGAGSGGPRHRATEPPDAGDGGGGGGVQASPAGVVEITASGTRFLRFNAWQPLAMAAAAGFVAGWLAGRRASR